MPAKTNAARILDAAGIYYELRGYEVDEDDLSAQRVAEKIGMPPEQVFKTLVARGDRTGILMAAIPANTELDLKSLAAASGRRSSCCRKCSASPAIRGGVSPSVKKHYPFSSTKPPCFRHYQRQRRHPRMPTGPAPTAWCASAARHYCAMRTTLFLFAIDRRR
jgi:Cys-tRNA(Pro)/Cys-tRNA(Cys) deacylase